MLGIIFLKFHILIYTPGELDFRMVAVKVIFGAGETKASVNVTILNRQQVIEPPEMFSVLLKSHESDVRLGNNLANITILNKNGESC